MQKSQRKNRQNKGFEDIYGIHSVISALKNNRRKHKLLTISSSNVGLLTKEIRNLVPKISILENKDIKKIYGNNNVHQGIILKTSSLEQPNIENILKQTKNKKIEIIVMLDQVSDPNNIGSIMRSCLLFNCKTIIVSKDNAPDVTPSMAKVASGALEMINYIKVINLSRTIKEFKKNNFWVFGLDSYKKKSNKKFEIPKKCLLVLGAEGKGLRKLTIKECDELISIPTVNNSKFNVDSLNVSNACSIALYQHFISNY